MKEAVKEFNALQLQLFEALVTAFPNEEQLKSALTKSRALSKLKPKECVTMFGQHVAQHRAKITARDTTLFNDEEVMANPFFTALNLNALWNGASDTTKNSLYAYLDALLEKYDAAVAK